MSISPRQKTPPLDLGWMIWGAPCAILALVILLLIVHGAAQHRSSSPAVAAEPSQAGQAAEESQSPGVNGEQSGDPGTQGDPNQFPPTGDPTQTGMTPNVPTQNAPATSPQSSQAQGSPTYSPTPVQPRMTQVPNQGELGVDPMTPSAPNQSSGGGTSAESNKTPWTRHAIIPPGERPAPPPPLQRDLVSVQSELSRGINSVQDGQDIIERGYEQLAALGINISHNFRLTLAPAAEVDKQLGPNSGQGYELGFTRYRQDSVPEVYICTNMDRDMFLEVFVHEATHVWMDQNVPFEQDKVIKEGMAQWVEVHVAQTENHSVNMDIYTTAQYPYGIGLRMMLAIEQKYGPEKVLEFAMTAKNNSEAKSLGVTW